MDTATQAEIAATPEPAQPTVEPSPAPAEPTASNPPPSSPDEVDAILFGGKAPAPTAKPEASAEPAKPEATPEPAATPPAQPAGVTPPAEAVETTRPDPTPEGDELISSDDDYDGLAKRYRSNHFPDRIQRILAVQGRHKRDHGRDLDWKIAEATVNERTQQAQATAAQLAEEAAATPDPITTMEQEVADIRAQLTEAGESGSLLTPAIVKLNSDLAEKVADLKLAKYAKEQEQRSQTASVVSSFADSKTQALKDYPALGDPESLLGMAVEAEVAAWQRENHPNHAQLGVVDAPQLVAKSAADKAAKLLAKQTGKPFDEALAIVSGLPPAAPAAAAPKAEAAPTVPADPQPAAGKLTVAPGSRTTAAAPAPAPTAQDLLKQSRTDPSFDPDTVLFPNGGGLLFATR